METRGRDGRQAGRGVAHEMMTTKFLTRREGERGFLLRGSRLIDGTSHSRVDGSKTHGFDRILDKNIDIFSKAQVEIPRALK